jgi:hypothetical protein
VVRVTAEAWLTKRELARELRVSVRQVERLHLPAMRVVGQNRYRLSEVEAHLRAPTRPADERGRAEPARARPAVPVPAERVIGELPRRIMENES